MQHYRLLVSNESETLLLSAELMNTHIQSCIIYLDGPVGSGKSFFCKGFLRALGYTGFVKSPTYTFVNSYVLSNGLYVHHFDFYRFSSLKDYEYIEIREYFDEYSICLVEWSKKVDFFLPVPDISITINYCSYNENIRQVNIKSYSALGQRMLAHLLKFKNF